MAKKLTTEDLVLNIIVNSNKAQSEIGKLGRTIQDNNSKLKAAEAEMKKLERANATSSGRYKQLKTDVAQYNSVIIDSKIRLGELNQTLSLQDKSLKQLETTLRRTRQLWRQATTDTDRQKYSREMDVLNGRIKELRNGAEQTGNALTRMSASFQRHFAVIAAGIASVISVFRKSFNTNMELEPINQALLTISGSTANFNRNMEFLRATADRLGLEFISTANAFKLWQGAAKYSNLTAEESRKIFESVANAGAKMKLSNEQVEGTFLALSQMMSKGKVQAEELRGQLGERLPGAFSLAAQAIGVTEQELNKMLEKGEVIAQDFLPKFAAQLDKAFGKDKKERIEGMRAATNRLSDEWDKLWQSERATTFFTVVANGFARMFKEINLMINSKSWAEFRAIAFGGLAEHAKWQNAQKSPIQRILEEFREKEKAQMEADILVYKKTVDHFKREGMEKDLKFNEAILYRMTEEYKRQYGVVKQIQTVKGDDATKDSERRKAYRKEIDDAEKHHQRLLQQEGLFREDLSELTNEQLEKMIEYNNAYQTELDRINNKYGENLKTVTNAAEKVLKKRLFDQEKYRQEVLLKEKSLLEQEKIAHDERLKQAGIYGKERYQLEGDYLKTYDALLKQHHANIDAIEDNAIAVDLEKQKKAYEQNLTELKIKHNNELSEITTLEQAKQYLRGKLNEKELSQVRDLRQARKVIQNQQFIEEEKLTREHLQKLSDLFNQAIASGEFQGIELSEEQKAKLREQLLEIRKMLSDMITPNEKDNLADASRGKTDILGMSQSDWDRLFQNIQDGIFNLEDLYDVLGAVTNMFSSYSNLVAQKENAMLQNDQDANERKKENLRKRLDDGTLTQESYNKQVEKLDRDMDKKRSEIQRKQAKREKAAALMSAIVNTARAVTAVLPNFILAALVSAFGAVQIGTIASTPLPSMEGREAGGFLQVERSQDGKVFNAKLDPDRRGYVENPTVIVGENGSEWVANAQAVKNPTVRPILDVLDTAQKNGTISTMNLQDIIAGTLGRRRVQGREVGGYVNRDATPPDSMQDQRIYEVLNRLDGTVSKLDVGLKNLKAEVAIIGKNGFLEKWTEYNEIEQDANI